MDVRIAELIAATRRRVRLAWLASSLAHILPYAFGVTALVGAAAWLLKRPLPLWAFVVVPVAAAIAVVISSRTRTWSDTEIARAVELRTGHDGALISALEFTDEDDDWHREVARRATAVAEDPNSRNCIPVRFAGQRTMATGAAAAVIALMGIFLPLGNGAAGAQAFPALEAEAAALEELADVLEDAADEAPDADEGESLTELADELRRLAEEIRNAESPLEAADRLEQEAEALREQAGDDLLTDKAAVQGLEQQLEASSLAPGGSASSQLDALAQAVADLTEQERQELAERLDRLADSQSVGNPDVAEALAQAAESLRAGNTSAASDALSSAADAQRAAVDDVASRDVSSAAANAAAGAAERLRDPSASRSDTASEGEGEGEGDGSGDGEGEGSGSGEGSGEGAGSGEGSGNGSGAPGSGASGEVSGASPTGGQSAGQGGQGTPGQGETSDGTTPPSRAQVFDPEQGGASVDVGVDIGGGVGEGDVVGRGDGTTTDGDAFVPLQDVLPSYLDTAATALDELDLPADLRSTVRDYFDHLAEN